MIKRENVNGTQQTPFGSGHRKSGKFQTARLRVPYFSSGIRNVGFPRPLGTGWSLFFAPLRNEPRIFWDLSSTNDSRFQCYKGHMERFQPGNPSTIFFGWRVSLVGGWTNPFEKYQSTWESSPNREENQKYLSCHHPGFFSFLGGDDVFVVVLVGESISSLDSNFGFW